MIQQSSDVLILGSGIVGMASLIAIDKYDIKATLLSEATALHKKEVDPRFYAITPGVKTWLEKMAYGLFCRKKKCFQCDLLLFTQIRNIHL